MKIQKTFLIALCFSLMFSISCFSEESHDHGYEAHQEEEHDAHENQKTSLEKEDEYDDDRHIPVSNKKEDEHGDHDDHEEEPDEDEEHSEEEGEVSSNVGPGNAVTEADHEKGFKLSEKAILTLEIKSREIKPQNSFTLPKESIVYSKDETGIYRRRNGWFKLIEGHTSKKESKSVTFRPENRNEFQNGDQIVINGVPLLRVTELDAFTAEAAGHAH